jgi:hypothetical protein
VPTSGRYQKTSPPPSCLLCVLRVSACDLLGSRRAKSGHARRAHTETQRRGGGPETSPPPLVFSAFSASPRATFWAAVARRQTTPEGLTQRRRDAERGQTTSPPAFLSSLRSPRLCVRPSGQPSRDVRPRQKGSHRDAETRRGARQPVHPPSCLLCVLRASACDLLGSRRATSDHARRAHTETQRRGGGPETSPPPLVFSAFSASPRATFWAAVARRGATPEDSHRMCSRKAVDWANFLESCREGTRPDSLVNCTL